MFAQTGRSRSGTLTAIAVAIFFAAGTAQAAPITIDTDTGTITINGIDSGGSIAGTGFTTRIVSAGGGNAGGLTEFVFQVTSIWPTTRSASSAAAAPRRSSAAMPT